MHLGSEESGPKVAAIMTVIASAQRAGANAREYLAWVLPKLADPATSEAALVEMTAGALAGSACRGGAAAGTLIASSSNHGRASRSSPDAVAEMLTDVLRKMHRAKEALNKACESKP
jgi:hypothetical protein